MAGNQSLPTHSAASLRMLVTLRLLFSTLWQRCRASRRSMAWPSCRTLFRFWSPGRSAHNPSFRWSQEMARWDSFNKSCNDIGRANRAGRANARNTYNRADTHRKSAPRSNLCLTEHGILHQKIPARSPQSNGISERMNRTVQDRARSMLVCWIPVNLRVYGMFVI